MSIRHLKRPDFHPPYVRFPRIAHGGQLQLSTRVRKVFRRHILLEIEICPCVGESDIDGVININSTGTHSAQNGVHNVSLPLIPLKIAVNLAKARIPQRLTAVEKLIAWLKPEIFGLALRQRNMDATHGIDDFRKGIKIDRHVTLDGNSEVAFDRAHGKIGTAVRIRSI